MRWPPAVVRTSGRAGARGGATAARRTRISTVLCFRNAHVGRTVATEAGNRVTPPARTCAGHAGDRRRCRLLDATGADGGVRRALIIRKSSFAPLCRRPAFRRKRDLVSLCQLCGANGRRRLLDCKLLACAVCSAALGTCMCAVRPRPLNRVERARLGLRTRDAGSARSARRVPAPWDLALPLEAGTGAIEPATSWQSSLVDTTPPKNDCLHARDLTVKRTCAWEFCFQNDVDVRRWPPTRGQRMPHELSCWKACNANERLP